MRILLLGYSRIGRRRVLPALRASAPDARIAIASRSAAAAARTAEFEWYDDYAEALHKSGAEVAYVTLMNSAHTKWVERALAAGLHVIVDKPACLDLGDATRLVALAQMRRLLLAEATVFSFHPQIDTLTGLVEQHGVSRPRVVTVFSFPALPDTDFRTQAALGGGAVWDLGPYAVASDRVLFQTPPEKVHAEVVSWEPGGLVTAFTVLFSHAERGALVGHFGFGTEYQNWLTVFGDNLSVTLPRAFTTTPDAPARVEVQSANARRTIEVGPVDAFAEFFTATFQAIRDGRIDTFASTLQKDAVLLGRVRSALAAS